MPDLNMNFDFLNDCWEYENTCTNKHFDSLTALFKNEIKCLAIPEDPIKTRYRKNKKWDLHIPHKKIAIEYKSGSLSPHRLFSNTKTAMGASPKNYFGSNIKSRVEEAIGCAVDVKKQDSEYKLGYLLVVLASKQKKCVVPKGPIDRTIFAFDKMVEDGVYDFFCPLITFGVDDHKELSSKYSFEKFITQINEVPSKHKLGLEDFFA